jgi:hypothetical protein
MDRFAEIEKRVKEFHPMVLWNDVGWLIREVRQQGWRLSV